MTLISGKGRLVAGLTGGPQEEEVPVASYPIIECQGVTKSFGAACAVKEVSLALEPGEIVALVGPTGSGKTTLLRMMAGFEAPDSGTVSVEGRLVAGPDSWVPPEGRRLGMVFQDYALFPHMTVIQNVAFGLQGWSTQDKEQRVLESLELVRLPSDLAERYPYQLSGGEQQRVALARSLAPRPIAILLDEPFSNVDHQMRMQLRAEVKNLLRSHRVDCGAHHPYPGGGAVHGRPSRCDELRHSGAGRYSRGHLSPSQ